MRPTRRQRTPKPPTGEAAELRSLCEAWGRRRFPGARMISNMALPGTNYQLDQAFIGEHSVAGIIIKTSKSVLHGLAAQVDKFDRHVPELWVAVPIQHETKFTDSRLDYLRPTTGLIVFENGAEKRLTTTSRGNVMTFASRDYHTIFAPMLELLYGQELIMLGKRAGFGDGFIDRHILREKLARRLTGDQIRAEVCGALRAREIGLAKDVPHDPPVYMRAA